MNWKQIFKAIDILISVVLVVLTITGFAIRESQMSNEHFFAFLVIFFILIVMSICGGFYLEKIMPIDNNKKDWWIVFFGYTAFVFLVGCFFFKNQDTTIVDFLFNSIKDQKLPGQVNVYLELLVYIGVYYIGRAFEIVVERIVNRPPVQ